MTNQCNLHCVHCYQQDDGPRQPVAPEDFLRKIANRIAEAGVFDLTLSGGEPLLVRSLRSLVGFFNEHGIRPRITSNGTLLTSSAVRWLARADVAFQVSIDSANPAVHDAIRGAPNAFTHAVAGVRRLVAAGVEVSLAYVATAENLAELDDVGRLAVKLGVKRLCIGEVLPFGPPERRDKLAIRPRDYESFVRTLVDVRSRYSGDLEVVIGCLSGHRYDASLRDPVCTAVDRDLAILHDGWAYPCPFVRKVAYRLGNVLEKSLSDIWTGAPAQHFRSEKRSGVARRCVGAGNEEDLVPIHMPELAAMTIGDRRDARAPKAS